MGPRARARLTTVAATLAGAAAPVLVGVALVHWRDALASADTALVLVVVVVGVAATGHRPAAVAAALSAALVFDVGFTLPYGSLTIDAPGEALLAVLLLTVGLVVGQVAARAARQRAEARRARRDLDRLHRASGLMARGAVVEELVGDVQTELCGVLGLRGARFDEGPPDPLLAIVAPDGSVAWGEIAWDTERFGLPARGVALPAIGSGRCLGAFTLQPSPGRAVTPDELALAVTLANQVGAALDGLRR